MTFLTPHPFIRAFMEGTTHKGSSFPPYNVFTEDNETFYIQMAIAGFTMDQLEIVKDKNVLTVTGTSDVENQCCGCDCDPTEVTYLHRGLAQRSFRRDFTLGDFVEVQGANLENGILTVTLKTIVPEDKKPQTIMITQK